LKARLKQDLKLMGLVNGDMKEQPSTDVWSVERYDAELGHQPVKALLPLPLPLEQALVRGEQERERELELELEQEEY
jgi:hypothetical protein